MNLNEVSTDDVRRELNDLEITRLALLRHWLIDGPDSQPHKIQSFVEDHLASMKFRSAPSIAIRSEAELFGINMPRFAYRAKIMDRDLTREPIAVVNLRRIRSFIKSIGKRLELSTQDEFLGKLERKCNCLADSILGVPNWASRYHVITTDLAKWYAETGPNQVTSFVTHFPVGGGMCAQAVCFMASALLHESANGVFGVAEVTMLAHDDPNSKTSVEYLNFSGLDIKRLVTYFEHPEVDLSARATPPIKTAKFFQILLRRCVHLNVPVIVPLDMRVLRKGAYQQLPYSIRPSLSQSQEPERHAVLVVAAKHNKEPLENNEFLIHDPATFPYLKISGRELFEAASSIDSGLHAIVIPVAPSRQLLDQLVPIQSDLTDPTGSECDPLLTTCRTAEKRSLQSSDQKQKTVSSQCLEQTPARLKLSLISSFRLDGSRRLGESLMKLKPEIRKKLKFLEYYVWMQSDVDEAISDLLGSESQLEITAVDALASIDPEGPLMKEVLTRYQSLDRLKCNAIALATFIPEIAAAPESDRGKRARQCLRFLGWLAIKIYDSQSARPTEERMSRIELVAGSRIGKVFQSLPLQSHIPEFIAEILPLSTVHRNIAKNLSLLFSEARANAKNLKYDLVHQLEKREIAFVLEQEPGPLFSLGSLESMAQLCGNYFEKESFKDFSKLIGLNLDIAHWNMSGITKQQIVERSNVFCRISHAHISGHHPKAHFGDTLLDETTLVDSHLTNYLELISLLKQLANEDCRKALRECGYPGYNGCVSVEFEAAPTSDDLETTLESADDLLS